MGRPMAATQDIRLPGNADQVFGAGMADGDRGVAARLPLHQEDCQGFAHDVAAAANDDVAAGGVVAVAQEQLPDSGGGAWSEGGLPLGQSAQAKGMDAVDILGRADGLYGLLLVDVRG